MIPSVLIGERKVNCLDPDEPDESLWYSWAPHDEVADNKQRNDRLGKSHNDDLHAETEGKVAALKQAVADLARSEPGKHHKTSLRLTLGINRHIDCRVFMEGAAEQLFHFRKKGNSDVVYGGPRPLEMFRGDE